MIWLLKHWKALAGAVLAACLWGHGYSTARTTGLLALQMERTKAEQAIAEAARAEAEAVKRAQLATQAAVDAVAAAQDEADKRHDQIEADYRRRISGVVSERDRLRKLWQAEQATDRLANSAAAAAAVAEQNRLRRESAARIVRAVETVQSERDEVIDRYEAVRRAVNGGG